MIFFSSLEDLFGNDLHIHLQHIHLKKLDNYNKHNDQQCIRFIRSS
jgi:hypothetical protein